MNASRLIVAVLASSIWLIAPLAQGASYTIALTNGRELVTPYVWEAGEEIRFYTLGGVAGVPRAMVKTIKASVAVPKDATAARPEAPSPGGVPSPPPATPSGHELPGDASGPPEDPDLTSYRQRKAVLVDQLDQATQAHLAASGAKDAAAKQSALEDMREASRRIYELADALKAKHHGVLPAWWHE